jgi:gliding motility-associated-like protein
LAVTFTSTATSARFYQWEFGDGGSSFEANPTYVYLRPGTFTVRLTVVGLGGSTNVVKNGIITISTKPESNFEVLNNFVVPDERVVFNNNSRGAIRYLWQFGDGDTSSLETPVHKYLQSGRYTVTLIAYNANGCADTFAIRDVIEVEKTARILIPNAFTPNPNAENDGSIFNTELNDVFYPVTRGAVSFRLEIYNRWGQLMFESRDKEKGWNGYYQGKLCPGGSYTYRLDVQFADGQTEVKFGDVTLIR